MSGARDDGRQQATAAARVDEDPNAPVVCSSPPCFMHELDPTYLGYLGREEVASLLDGILAADWGGAVPRGKRLRAALCRHLQAYNGSTSAAAAVRWAPDDLARTIREALPRIHAAALRRDLGEVLQALERGVASPGES